MRKNLLLISLCVIALSASAQFKVQSNGNIAIHTNSTAVSPIAINGAGSSSYYMYCNVGEKKGFYLTASGTGSGTNWGIMSHAGGADVSAGVIGEAGSTVKAIGLVGSVGNFGYGAGVYGTIYSDMGSALTSGKYAGFFHGNVKVTGNVEANNIQTRSLLGESASESGSSGNGISIRSASIASCLSGLNVTTYQKERPEKPKITETIYDDLGIDTLQRGKEPEPDIIDEQYYEKTHYALDADRLEETFPDLVYEREDGSKVINYMEMIPLLVQSINELSAKIEVLEGQTSEGAAKKTRSATNKQASSISQNKLYQNTPNPFKEQTVIRFSLADDIQDASICIFDMTGKTIKKLPISSGMESVSIGGYELGEGIFLYSLVVNGQEIDTKKMIISK
ncbi:MAG: T9SS type A sorting domain-containing protein [Prevotella sp.]|nr:T9SS type A sorting domain-containing protein [Prevotella sp.]